MAGRCVTESGKTVGKRRLLCEKSVGGNNPNQPEWIGSAAKG